MPHQLFNAAQEPDKAVDSLYRPNAFAGDRDRVEHLFSLYKKRRSVGDPHSQTEATQSGLFEVR